MRLQGAWDAGLIKWLFETYQLFDIEPNNDLLNNETPEIRVAASSAHEKVVVYIPFNAEVHLKIDLSNYDCLSFNLSDRLVAHPEIQPARDDSIIRMHDFNSDVFVICVRRT